MYHDVAEWTMICQKIEPLRVDRRLFRLCHAAMAGSFSMA